jgi:hypothetical protein
MNVRKRGRTTGLTYGKVDSVSLSVSIDYGDGIGVKILTNQIGITPDTPQNAMFGKKGDSGSVVVDDNRKVVGLYFAGDDDGYGVANPIAAVLAALNISMCVAPTKPIIKDFKDGKREKFEIKERKWEKLEIKERKPEKFEVEGHKSITSEFIDPKISELDPVQPPFDPTQPGLPMPGGLEQRVAQLEAVIGQLTAFIGSELRPDLSTGALSHEPDCAETRRRLQKDAVDAVQAKTEYDNKMG